MNPNTFFSFIIKILNYEHSLFHFISGMIDLQIQDGLHLALLYCHL